MERFVMFTCNADAMSVDDFRLLCFILYSCMVLILHARHSGNHQWKGEL